MTELRLKQKPVPPNNTSFGKNFGQFICLKFQRRLFVFRLGGWLFCIFLPAFLNLTLCLSLSLSVSLCLCLSLSLSLSLPLSLPTRNNGAPARRRVWDSFARWEPACRRDDGAGEAASRQAGRFWCWWVCVIIIIYFFFFVFKKKKEKKRGRRKKSNNLQQPCKWTSCKHAYLIPREKSFMKTI